jgi:hypothetical protein
MALPSAVPVSEEGPAAADNAARSTRARPDWVGTMVRRSIDGAHMGRSGFTLGVARPLRVSDRVPWRTSAIAAVAGGCLRLWRSEGLLMREVLCKLKINLGRRGPRAFGQTHKGR